MSARVEPPSLDVDAVLAILSRPDDVDLAELVELVARICDSEAAGITVQRGGEYHVPVTHGIEPLVCPSDDTFCRATMSTDGVFTVEDAKADPRFSSIGFVDGSARRCPLLRLGAALRAQRGDGRPAVRHRPRAEDADRTCSSARSRRSALSVTKLIELRLLARTARAVCAGGGPGRCHRGLPAGCGGQP